MLMIKRIKYKNIIVSLLILLLFTINSCKNLFEDSISENNAQVTENPQPGTSEIPELPGTQNRRVSCSGSVSVSRVLPSEIRKIVNTSEIPSDNTDRSATAALPSSSDYEYYVRAVAATDTQEVIPTLTNSGRVFELQLLVDVEYTLTAGFRKKNSETDLLKDWATISGHPAKVTLTAENLLPDPYSFVLSPLQTSGGKGALNLTITSIEDTDISNLKLFVSDSNGLPEEWQTSNLDINITGSGEKYIRSKKDSNGNILYNIPSGTYEVCLNFYKTDYTSDFTYIAYSTVQTINVYDNLVTDIWQNENASSTNSVITSGEFKLTASLVNNFLNNLLYVGIPENLAGNSSVIPASDSNTGRAYSPLKTLGRALSLIAQAGNGSDYRIYVTGDYNGNYNINDAFDSKAASVEIKGIGSSKSVLQGSGATSVFTISTTTPIIFENVQITNNERVDKGAGLNIFKADNATTGPSVTLGSGTLVGKEGSGEVSQNYGNYGKKGTGVYIKEGKLTLKNGSKICRNYTADRAGGGEGGGIYCEDSSLVMEAGAEVSDNKSEGSAGGIYLNNSSFTMKGGLISNNIAVGENAGGLYIDSTSSFIMKGGTISNNQSSVKGGGVTVKKGGSLKLSGSAAIPFGVTENSTTTKAAGKNDIYLERTTEGSAVIELSGPVASDFSEVGITTGGADSVDPDDWVLGQQVVNAASGATITDTFAEKINCLFPDEEWDKVVSSYVISVSCPFFVGSYYNTWGTLIAGSDEDGHGTKASPYATIQKACQQMNDKNIDYVIKIIGTTAGLTTSGGIDLNKTYTQSITSSLKSAATATYKANSVLITGARGLDEHGMPQDKIDRGAANSLGYYGTALEIETSVPVTITKLLITGARENTTPQSGLDVGANAKVTLGDGVVITGNSCTPLYVNNGAKVAICGTCIIGNPNVSEKPQDEYTDSTQTNSHGVKCEGELYLGARMNADGTHTEKSWTGAIMGNNGCGLYIDGSANDSYPKDNPVKCIMYSGSIKCNYDSISNGGGINFSGEGVDAELTIKGGEIKDNNVKSDFYGTGIYFEGDYTEGKENILTLDGPISIVNNDLYVCKTPYLQNDVQYYYNTLVTVTDNFSLQNSANKIPLTVYRGSSLAYTDVFTGSVSNTNIGYLDFSVTGFKLAHIEESNNHYGRIVFKHILKDLYVASTGTDSKRTGPAGLDPSGNGVPDSMWQNFHYDSNDENAVYSFNEEKSGSNATHPFATIEKALQFITYQQTLTDENGTPFDYTIYIDGKVLGTHVIQDVSKWTARKIILKSRNTKESDTEPKDILDANLPEYPNENEKAPCLKIVTDVPIEITNLKITGGKARSTGGGIYIGLSNGWEATTDLTINGVTQIVGNEAPSGGGIYCGGVNSTYRALLKICGKARVFDNKAGLGGGVKILNGDMCLYEDAVIGTAGKSSYAKEQSPTSGHSNYAGEDGGGIYALNSGIYIGYDTTTHVAENFNGGVMYNYVHSQSSDHGSGGGIYIQGSNNAPSVLKIAKGKISENGTDTEGTDHYSKGGGIYLGGNNVSFEMTGGTIENNGSSNGGGLYAEASNAAITIGKNVTIQNNYAIVKGGGIYSERSVQLSATMNNNRVSSGNIGGGIFMGHYGHELTLDSDFNIATENYTPTSGKDDITLTFTPAERAINSIISNSLSNFSEDRQIGLTIDDEANIFTKLAGYGTIDSIIKGEAKKYKLLIDDLDNQKYRLAYTNGNTRAEFDTNDNNVALEDLDGQAILNLYESKMVEDNVHSLNAVTALTDSNNLTVLTWDDYIGVINFSFTERMNIDSLKARSKLYQKHGDNILSIQDDVEKDAIMVNAIKINLVQWATTTEDNYQVILKRENSVYRLYFEGQGESTGVKWYTLPRN